MKNDKSNSRQNKALRSSAKKQLADKEEIDKKLSPKDTRKLVHELQVHQFELEMQNEELRRVQQEHDELEQRVAEQTKELRQANEELRVEITERKRAEKALEKSAQLLRDIEEMAKVGGWELDLSTREVSWTEEVGRIHGVEPGYKPKLEEALNFYAPESRPALEATLKKTIETGEPYDLESLFIPSGSKDKIWVRSLGRAIYSGGKIVKLAGTFQDIDKYKRAEEALRQSEKNYRNLFDNANDAIFVAQDGKLVFLNPMATVISGYSGEELISRPFIEFIHPDDRDMVLDWHVRRIKGEEIPPLYPFRIFQRDGNVRWVELNVVLISWMEKPATLNFLNDITERKQAEEKMRNSRKQLEQLNRHLTDVREEERALISRDIHDELGQSLTVLKIDLHWALEHGGGKPEVNQKLNEMLEIVSETITTVQRIASDLRPGILDDLGLTSAVEWYCEEFEQRTGIQCLTDLEDIQLQDPQKKLALFRILQESLTNVIRHAHAKNVTIKLSRLMEAVNLEIQDDGIGISQEEIDSHNSLGLIGIRERVRQFDGEFEIFPQHNKGTGLRISIPLNE